MILHIRYWNTAEMITCHTGLDYLRFSFMFRSKVSYAKVTQPAVCLSDLKLLNCQDLLMFWWFSRLIRFIVLHRTNSVIITIKSLWFPRAQRQDDRCSIKMSREMNPPPASALSGGVKPRHCLCDLHITADGLQCLHWDGNRRQLTGGLLGVWVTTSRWIAAHVTSLCWSSV